MTISNEGEKLSRLYAAFINETDRKRFFIGFKDYFDYCTKLKTYKDLENEFFLVETQMIEEYVKLSLVGYEELQTITDEAIEIINKTNPQSDLLPKLGNYWLNLTRAKQYLLFEKTATEDGKIKDKPLLRLKGEMSFSYPLNTAFGNDDLYELIKDIPRDSFKSKFDIHISQEDHPYDQSHIVCSTDGPISQLLRKYRIFEKQELWGEIYHLRNIYHVLAKHDAIEIEKINEGVIYTEPYEVVLGSYMPEAEEMIFSNPQIEGYYFNINKIKPICIRLHTALLNKLELLEGDVKKLLKKGESKRKSQVKSVNSEVEDITFDISYNKLSFGGKNVQIRNSKLMPNLLRILLTKPEKAKFVTDVIREVGLDDFRTNSSMRDGIRQINDKLKGIGIKDKIFSYRGEKVLTNEGYLERLKIR